MVTWPGRQVEAIDCAQVSVNLAPCLPYLTAGGPTLPPSPPCCAGVRRLKDMAPAKADRQAVCECVKAASARYPNLKPDAASALPQKCSVPTSIPISPTINCQK